MPVYEYQCGACNHLFEEWQKITDAPIDTCPKCHSKQVQRLISHTSFQLKGGGWYGDLYASKKPGSGGSSSSGSSSGGSSSGSSSSSSGGSKAASAV